MFLKLEKPVAYATFGYAVVTMIWKSPMGLDWIPVLGPAWTAVFASDDSIKPIAQYPRRTNDEDFWHMVYFLMYGVLGTYAQYGGMRISCNRRLITRESLVFYCKVYGAFHTVIACHHLLWSIKQPGYGKLELWRFQLPGVYSLTCLAALMLIFHASVMMRVSVRTADLKDICYRKSVMDTVTCLTFVSFAAFLCANMAGIETSHQADRFWWAVTMYPVCFVLFLGFLLRK